MGLTIEYIEEIGKQLFSDHFYGCYPADIQPRIKKKTFSIIFNLSNHNEEGSHFVAIFADTKYLLYFDSFGEKCSNKLILKFLKKEKKDRVFKSNKRVIQSCDSAFCGFFCIGFILSQQMKLPLTKFVKLFSNTNLKQNDDIVIKFINDIVKNEFIDQ